MAIEYGQEQEVRRIKASELKPRQMAVDSDGDYMYCDESGMVHFLIPNTGIAVIASKDLSRFNVTPLPKGSTIVIRSEV